MLGSTTSENEEKEISSKMQTQTQKEEGKEKALQEKEIVNSSCSVAETFLKCETKVAKRYRSNFKEFSKWVLSHKAIEKKLSRFDNLEEILHKLFVRKIPKKGLNKVRNMENFLKLFNNKEIRYVFPTNNAIEKWWVL